MSQFIAQFGAPGEGEAKADFTLYQAAEIYLSRYKVAPIVAVNVFDPARHSTPGTGEGSPGSAGREQGRQGGDHRRRGCGQPQAHRPGSGGRGFPPFSPDSRPGAGSALFLGPRGGAGPGRGLQEHLRHFRALGIYETPDTVTRYTDLPAWINENNLADPNLLCMFGHGLYNNEIEWGSAHLAGVIGQRDAENSGIPFWSPSNKSLLCEGLVHAGRKLHLTPVEAAYCNGQGIVTGISMIGGLRAWGDQTTAYPGNSDVKDASIPIRRMFNWVGNTLVLTSWQFVSNPMRRRMVETVQDTFNVWLNGLVGREFLLGGRVAFEQADNPTSDLMDGKVRWHVYLCPPQAARELVFVLEYDPQYLSTLFGESAA